MPHSSTYGFGSREGRHLNLLCERLMAFSEEQDISLPELLGYLDLAKDAFIDAMIRPHFNPSEAEPPEFGNSEP